MTNTVWITGDGYTDEGYFLDAATRALGVLASDPEVGHVVGRMLVRQVFTRSNSGQIPVGASGDTAFGSYIHPNGNLRLNVGSVLSWRTRMSVAYHDVVLLLVNSAHFGGAYNGAGSIAYVGANGPHFAELLKHEFLGHAIGGLGDEYGRSGVYTGGGPSARNLDTESQPVNVKWSHMIGRDDGMGGTVGVFEGGGDYARGLFRPTRTSKMRQLYKPFGPVNAEAITLAAARFIPRLEGDLNGDGRVDFDDLNLALIGDDFDQVNSVLSNFGRTDHAGGE